MPDVPGLAGTGTGLRADLHLHSTASDGTVPPEAVVDAAVAGGLTVLSLTDHDTAAGVPAAAARAASLGVRLISGIEVSARWEEGEVHLLGYGIAPNHPGIEAHARQAGDARVARMEAMVDRLRRQGIGITMEAVEAAAGATRESLARPHLARALVAAGVVEHPWEAFDRYIGDGHPAYLPASLIEVEEALDLIHGAGGVSSWAHPPEAAMDALLPRLCRAGLQGLEVHRPRTPADRLRRLGQRARSAGLLPTGGSDWHGPEGGELGAFHLAEEQVGPFLQALDTRS